MRVRKNAVAFGLILAGAIGAAGYAANRYWPNPPAEAAPDQADSASPPAQSVRLSKQAQANLRLAPIELRPTTYWRSIELPAEIVDRPGKSDLGVSARAAGVVAEIHAFPGEAVRPGEPLVTLRLVSEALHSVQAELFKTARDVEITREQRERLGELGESGSIPRSRLIELDNQLRRLAATEQACRQDLQARGFTSDQIDGVAQGRLVTETVVVAPAPPNSGETPAGEASPVAASADPPSGPLVELQELRVELGQHVEAGETLCLLSHHETLFVEGRAFHQEIPLLQRATQESWPVEIEFAYDDANSWPEQAREFHIHHVANTLDPASRTFAFYVPLANQSRTYEMEGRTHFLWRFSPGQRARVRLKVEPYEDCFVLPADALVREGAEAYVFRWNGDLFDRQSVHVLFQDRRDVVVANDWSVPAGTYIAGSGAHQLNRALKAQTGAAPAGVHVHADGTVHGH